MKRLRWLPVLVATAILVSACSPKDDSEELIQENEQENVETTIIPNHQLNDNYYRTLIPYKESASRGLVVSNMNTKYDMREVESGLMRLSQREFNTNDYYFQEGQYLDAKTVKYWLARESQTRDEKEELQGLNPSHLDANGAELEPTVKAEKAPIYLSHIVEQNYLKKTDDTRIALGGMSIGLSLNTIYYYQKEQYGEFFEQVLTDEQIEKAGKEMAEEIIHRLRQREDLKNVPIMIGLFKQQAKNSIVPGTYFAYSVSKAGSEKLGEWQSINEKYMTLPVSNPEDIYRELNTNFLNFKQDIDEYFANFTSVIGTAFYVDNKATRLEVEIPIQFYGTAEIIGFTQYLTGVMLEELPSNLQVTINVHSVNGAEALIKKEPGSNEPFVHIYD